MGCYETKADGCYSQWDSAQGSSAITLEHMEKCFEKLNKEMRLIDLERQKVVWCDACKFLKTDVMSAIDSIDE